MLKNLIAALTLFLFTCSNAATVDTIAVYSKSMHKEFKCVVIKPTLVQGETRPLPVVYLLHGYDGRYSNWIEKAPQLKEYADQYRLMIVCPDGANSWYLDSPVDTDMKFETYIGKELPAFIDTNYPTIKDRKARAITGLSMGGHGGLFLGLRHSDIFGACGSMSGGVDLRPFPNSWELSKRVGDTIRYAANWKNYSVTTIVEQYAAKLDAGAFPLAIMIDCGTEDFFYPVNHALHEKMIQLKIPHDYIERPGSHDWNYWINAIRYQLLFFSAYFQQPKGK